MKPLADLRIVAVEQYGAGPFGTMHLADLGAEVIKIEEPASGGDVARYVPPFQEGEDSLFFETYNRNKRSLSLDLETAAGRSVFEDLVRVSDAVFSNLRGDVPARLRIRYDDLKAVNPRIVCCSLSGFGMTGSRVSQPAYDYILQGLAGWMSLTGGPEHPPTKSGLSLVDFSGGFVAAIALLTGIHAARRDGVGMDCDLSLFDTAVSLLGYVATWQLNAGYVPERAADSAHPSLVPFQNFATSDGWIVVGCAKEKFWTRLVDAMGLGELAAEPRFADFAGRREHKAMLLPLLKARFLERSSTEWLKVLNEAGVPCAPVRSVGDALDDEDVVARGMIVGTEHPRFGTVRQPVSPVRVGSEPMDHRRAPQRHEDAGHVLSGLLGYTDEHIQDLDRSGAFGRLTPAGDPEPS
jgi:crotonobetainyl-CoA:carnitine CoA-transferase CaiB-like acyl-CoA transferase